MAHRPMRRSARGALVAVVALCVGCNSTSSPSGSSSGSSGSGSGSTRSSVSATINNVPWVADGSITAAYTAAQASASPAAFHIVATDASQIQTFDVAFGPLANGTGLTPGTTYRVGASSTSASLTVTVLAVYQAGGQLGDGYVTLDTFNPGTKTATGTFEFTLWQVNGIATRVVSNGAFTVTF
jgi:hypothetical protein